MDVAELFGELITEVKAYVDDQVEARLASAVQKMHGDMQKAVESAVAAIPKPENGKDAPPVDLAKLQADILKQIPVPKDGKDAEPVDIAALRESILKEIPIPKDGKDGADGINGKDAEPVDIAALRQSIVKDLPIPKDGKDGLNGKDADEESITKKVLESIVLPTPRDGVDGKDVDPLLVEALVAAKVAEQVKGIKPENGRDGKDFDPALMREYVDVAVEKRISLIPKPQDGKDGQSVTVDDVAPLLSAELDKKEIELERRNEAIIQRTIDRIPKGRDGRDALEVDDFFAELSEDSRTIKLGLRTGDRQVVKELKLPTLIYQGVYETTRTYEKGDNVTYGGSLWVAMKDAPSTPGTTGSGWKLAVQRGKDAAK